MGSRRVVESPGRRREDGESDFDSSDSRVSQPADSEGSRGDDDETKEGLEPPVVQRDEIGVGLSERI